MERRHRRSRREKLEEELNKTIEAIAQYTDAIAAKEEKKETLIAEIENERIREVTKLLKEKNLSVEQLTKMIGNMDTADSLAPEAVG